MIRDDRFNWFRVELKGFDDFKPQLFIYRGMSKRESVIYDEKYKEDPYTAQTYLLEQCIGDQYDWDQCPAGSAMTLVELILSKSVGYSETMWEEANLYLSTPIGVREAMACAVLPSVDFKVLENCDSTYYAKYILFGVNLFQSIYPENPLLKYLEPEKKGDGFGQTEVKQAYPGQYGEVGHETSTFSWSKSN